MKTNRGTYDEYYKQLEGFTIKKFLGMSEEEYGDGFPQFIIGNGTEDIMMEVSQDPEGNDGGFLFLSDIKVECERKKNE